MSALARLGLAARGLVYLLIGSLAVLMALGRAHHQASQQGAFQALAAHTGGFAVLVVVFVGLVGYALWRMSEAAFGVAGEGSDALPRLKAAGSGVAYAVLALSAFDVLTHRRGGGGKQRLISARIMAHSGGRVLVGVVGVAIAVAGVALAVEGVRRRFAKQLDFAGASPRTRRGVLGLGALGNTARGIVFVVIGVLVLDAALIYRPARVSGMDGALRALETVPAGRAVLAVVAVGLVCFGLYGLAEARYRKT